MPKSLPAFLKSHNLHAKKRFGQNFLVDKNVLNRIVAAADLQADDIVVEIGPGLGVLTEQLAQKTKKVIAIEKDRDLIPILKKNLKSFRNIEILNQDALKFDPPATPYKIVANIPYYITSPIINHFLKDQYVRRGVAMQRLYRPSYKNTTNHTPTSLVLLTQKEVAQKICAKPPHLNVLALNTQIFGQPQIIGNVNKNCFYPVPKVDSAILKITPHPQPAVNCDLPKLFPIINAAFAQKRKNLRNSLSNNLQIPPETTTTLLKQAKIDPTRRPQTLTLTEWETLSRIL